MGRSLTSNHIFNAEKLTKAQFKKKFTDMMKAKGYTSAKADDGELCYALFFSGDRSWVTVLTEESTDTRKEASELAKNLGLQVLSAELVDSDFAELTLYEKSGAAVDTMFLGEPYFEEYPEPSPLKWQTLLNIDWAKVEEIHSKDHTFADDALCEFGEVIGCENMLLEFDGVDDDAVRLYFKKAGEKKLTLNAAFKQVFGPELESRGFKLIKGSNVYVRVMNGEIVQLVTVVKEKSNPTCLPVVSTEIKTDNLGNKKFPLKTHDHFNVVCCIKSIYDEIPFKPDKLSLDYTFFDNCEMLKKGFITIDNIEFKDVSSFTYQKDNKESLMAAMNYNLEISKKVMFPQIEKITNLDELFYSNIFLNLIKSLKLFLICDDFNVVLSKKYNSYLDDEIRYIRENYSDDIDERIEKAKEEKKAAKQKRLKFLNDIIENEEKYKEVMSNFENNKSGNILFLRKNGILINEENEDEQIH